MKSLRIFVRYLIFINKFHVKRGFLRTKSIQNEMPLQPVSVPVTEAKVWYEKMLP